MRALKLCILFNFRKQDSSPRGVRIGIDLSKNLIKTLKEAQKKHYFFKVDLIEFESLVNSYEELLLENFVRREDSEYPEWFMDLKKESRFYYRNKISNVVRNLFPPCQYLF